MTETITEIESYDRQSNLQVDELLAQEGIRRDGNLDYTCGIFDDDWNLIATGSCFHNTIRCLAVSSRHQGEGLLNQVISHLMDVQMSRGNSHLFLYTKPSAAKFMSDLGFYEIARVSGTLVFMENRRDGFTHYCSNLMQKQRDGERIAGIVMNANPFTNGHLHLVEQASRENDVVHLFILSEEAGPIPFSVRRQLVRQGVAHLSNVICHDSGPYMISSATFPSYFLKDSDCAIQAQAELDLLVFGKIAACLGIQRRYVGQEHSSHVTALYNSVMARKLPQLDIDYIEIPRLAFRDQLISASTVRQAIHDGRLEDIRPLVPESTYTFFASEAGKTVCTALQAEENVIHY